MASSVTTFAHNKNNTTPIQTGRQPRKIGRRQHQTSSEPTVNDSDTTENDESRNGSDDEESYMPQTQFAMSTPTTSNCHGPSLFNDSSSQSFNSGSMSNNIEPNLVFWNYDANTSPDVCASIRRKVRQLNRNSPFTSTQTNGCHTRRFPKKLSKLKDATDVGGNGVTTRSSALRSSREAIHLNENTQKQKDEVMNSMKELYDRIISTDQNSNTSNQSSNGLKKDLNSFGDLVNVSPISSKHPNPIVNKIDEDGDDNDDSFFLAMSQVIDAQAKSLLPNTHKTTNLPSTSNSNIIQKGKKSNLLPPQTVQSVNNKPLSEMLTQGFENDSFDQLVSQIDHETSIFNKECVVDEDDVVVVDNENVENKKPRHNEKKVLQDDPVSSSSRCSVTKGVRGFAFNKKLIVPSSSTFAPQKAHAQHVTKGGEQTKAINTVSKIVTHKMVCSQEEIEKKRLAAIQKLRERSKLKMKDK